MVRRRGRLSLDHVAPADRTSDARGKVTPGCQEPPETRARLVQSVATPHGQPSSDMIKKTRRRIPTQPGEKVYFRRWLLSIGCLVVIACAAGLARTVGMPSDVAGAVVVGGVTIISAAAMLRTLPRQGRAPAAARWAAVAALAATAASPAIASMLPGAGIASRVLRQQGDELLLPEGEIGLVRILVTATLPGNSTASAGYTLVIDGKRIEGTFERSIRRAWRKMGRFLDERTSAYHSVRVAPDMRALTLERVKGRLEDGLHVRIFRARAPSWVFALLGVASLALATAVDVTDKRQGMFAMYAGIALVVGALARWNATPESAFASAVASLILGVPLGTAAGLAAYALAGRVRRHLPR